MPDADQNLVVEFKEMRKTNCRKLEKIEIIEDCKFDSGNGVHNTGRLRPMVEFHGKKLTAFVDLRDLRNSEIQWLVKMESPLIFSRKSLQSYLNDDPGYASHIVQLEVAEAMLRKYVSR